MTLIDEWDFQGPSGVHVAAQDLSEASLGDLQEVPTSPGAHPNAGLFTLEPLDRQLARGRGRVTGAAVASESLLIVTSRAVLLRFDFSVGMTPVSEVELSRAPDASATAVRVDDSGEHALVSVKSGNTLGSTAEHMYINSKWKKAKPIPKLKGINISAVAWNAELASEGSSGPVIVGDNKGQLLEVVLDEKEKREPPVKALYSFEDAPASITGLQQHLAQHRTLVLVATVSRLYVFVGGKDLEPLFAAYPESAADLQNYLHAPQPRNAASGLLETWAPLGSHTSSRFAWLSAAGLQQGKLRIDLEQRPSSDLEYLAMEPDIITLEAGTEPIKHMAMTEFHYLLLGPNCLHIYNRISGQLVQEVAISGPGGVLPAAQEASSMLLRDAEAAQAYLVAGESLHEVVMENEEKDLWHAFLQKGDYAMAARYANGQMERDAVSKSEAEAAFQDGDFKHAARLWGRMQAGDPSFEEITLRLVDVGATEALQVFLMARLQALAPDDKAQATMVASWMVELHLDQINRALLEDSSEANSRSEAHTEALRTFLKDHVDVLDVNVTISLLASYGRMDDLMHYATYRQDNETLLEYLLQRGEEGRALAVLRRHNISHELVYKFAPALLAAAPGDTIDAWIACKPPLDARRLLPALMNACEASQDSQLQGYALRFVEHCISQLQSTDTTLHNLAVTLYSQDADEQRLLHYLRTARGTLGSPLYDPQFALQVARQHGKLNACVQLLCELSLHEDAVALALTFDKAAATAVAANQSDGDEALQRKLWLAIARHLIVATNNGADNDPKERVAAVVEILGEAEGRICIEDVLPLFPDFVTIDAFKAAICSSLEDYNAQIEGLKTEMADSTRIADALRKDISALESQAATLDLSELCACCGRQIGSAPPASASATPAALPQFYLFPTGNAFHGACLAKEVMAAAPPPQQSAISALLKQLSQDLPEQQNSLAQESEARKTLRDKLEQLIAYEDPYSGETVVRIISKGFDRPPAHHAVDDWKI